MKTFDSIGGRRFILSCASLLLTFLLQWFGKLDLQGMAYGLVIGATVGAFIAGQVSELRHVQPRGEDRRDQQPKN